MQRRGISMAVLIVAANVSTLVSAANPPGQAPYRSPAGAPPMMGAPGEFVDDGACDCEACRARRAGPLARRNAIEGKDLNYNCGCQGSYKFPVPPLYTYHWPGMYSQRLMTDYHSPWRFPPIKPFMDETKVHDARPMPAAAKASMRISDGR